MRLDIFLKKVLLFKKRSEAKKMCEYDLVKINGKEAKPSKHVNPGDIIAIESRKGVRSYRVLDVPRGNVRKSDIGEYCEEIP